MLGQRSTTPMITAVCPVTKLHHMASLQSASSCNCTSYAGIITEGCLMAEELNVHFSSVFTREDTSSLPVPETKFNGSEEEKLGQLVVTPEVVASKINNMKENKSPGVDGLSPKILKETVEQISKPLAHVFNMLSLQEGIVPVEWKVANIIPLFKQGSRNKSVN